MTGKRTFRWDAWIVFALALIARLVYMRSIMDEPLWLVPQVDARLYWETALSIVRGEAQDAVFYLPPFYSWFLASIVRVVGEDVGSVRHVLAIVAALAAPVTLLLAEPIVGRARSLAAGVIVALFAPAVFYSSEILTASLVLLLNVAALYVLARSERAAGFAGYGLAGILIGVSAITHPSILLLPLLLAIRYRTNWRAIALLVLGLFLAVLPVTLHNALGGDAALVSTNGGVNFYMGNHAGADGKSAVAPDLPNEPGDARRTAEAIARASVPYEIGPRDVSGFWMNRATIWIRENPGDWARLTFRRLVFAVNNREISDNIDFYGTIERSIPLRMMPLHYGLLIALAVTGIPVIARHAQGRLLLVYALAVLVPLLLFFVVGRLRLPLLPLLAIAGSAGLFELVRFVRKWRHRLQRKELVRAPLLFAGAFVLAHLNVWGVNEDRSWHYYYLSGDATWRHGNPLRAVEYFEQAHQRNPEDPLAMNALGFAYAETGQQLEHGEELVRGALDREPGRRRFYLDSLGWILFKQGKNRKAAAAFEQAIPLFGPGEEASKAEAMTHLAAVREAQGRTGEAKKLRAEAGRLLAM